MTLNLSNYSSVYYRSQIESKRIELIKELIYSDSADRLDILKRLHPEESNLELKFEIRRAIDDLESVKSNSFSTENDYDDKLRQTLRYGDITVRHKTLSAIVSNRRSDLLHMLRELSPLVRDPYMEAAILKLLALNPVKNLKEICSYLKSSDDRVIASAIQIVGNINNTQSLALIANYLTHQNNRVRSNAAIAFEKSDPELAKKVIEKMAYSEYVAYRSSAAYALSVLSFHGSAEILDFLITDSDPGVRAKAHKARLKIDSELRENNATSMNGNLSTDISASSPVEKISDSLSQASDPRKLATLILQCSQVNANDEDKISLIKPYLQHTDDRVRANAVESLSIIYPDAEKDFFLNFLCDKHNRVIGNAIFILSNEDHCPEKYLKPISKAFEDLLCNHQINGCLTALYCIGNCRDDNFLPFLIRLTDHNDIAVTDKAHALLVAWAETSGSAKIALRDTIKTNLSKSGEIKNLLE